MRSLPMLPATVSAVACVAAKRGVFLRIHMMGAVLHHTSLIDASVSAPFG